MERSTESLWLGLCGLFIAAGAAFMALGVTLHVASSKYPLWTSSPMITAYALAGLACGAFACAVRDVPIPGIAAGQNRRLRRAAAHKSQPDGKSVTEFRPFDLEIHQAPMPADGAPVPGNSLPLTPYLRRSHDAALQAALEEASTGGPSVFAVLKGDSCTGKTRALYEALHDLAPNWPLLRPADAGELADLLDRGRFTTGTVLWLNETQRHLSGAAGERAANRLKEALSATRGAIAVGALWPKPYFEELTATGRSPDDNANARALLLDNPHSRVVDVPSRLTAEQQESLAELAQDDDRVQAALAASGPGGDVIQHLTGGPELRDAFTSRTFFTSVERALITAALDARRFGHQTPLPGGLLAAAVDGYLAPHERPSYSDWATTALTSLTTGIRADGSASGIRNALTTLRTFRVHSGDPETGYEPDDYLDQHTRQLRKDRLGSAQLWEALARHAASADDLNRLAEAASDRGLYRYAASLWRKATASGHLTAPASLLALLQGTGEASSTQAGQWIADQASLDDPAGAADLLNTLRRSGSDRSVVAEVAARAVGQASLHDPEGAAHLLDALSQAEVNRKVMAKAVARVAAQVSLERPGGPAYLLDALQWAGVDKSVTAKVMTELAARPSFSNPENAVEFLNALNGAGVDGAVVTEVAARAADQASPDNRYSAANLLKASRKAATNKKISVRAAEQTSLDDLRGADSLLVALKASGSDPAIVTRLVAQTTDQTSGGDLPDAYRLWGALRQAKVDRTQTAEVMSRIAARAYLNDIKDAISYLEVSSLGEVGRAEMVRVVTVAAIHASLDDPSDAAYLLDASRWAEVDRTVVAELAGRAADRASLDDAGGAARLLDALQRAEVDRSVIAELAGRAADRASLDDAGGAARLLDALQRVKVDQTVMTRLASRAAAEGRWRWSLKIDQHRAVRYRFGQEVDGSAAPRWDWQLLERLDEDRS